MKLGFSLPVAGEWATPEGQVRVARHAEALGYQSLRASQRLLYAGVLHRAATLADGHKGPSRPPPMV